MHPILIRIVAVFLCYGLFTSQLANTQLPDLSQLEDPISTTDHLLADQLANQISNTEWLGVLAPVAISPFFGITCLAGMSQFGGEVLGTNSFISNNPVLNSPAVFWIFLGLTLLTSLPRLTKVSKPMAQAVDQIEAYSGIITLLVMRFMVSGGAEPGGDVVAMQMGAMSFTVDTLLGVAAVINIIVINTVKFFFEILVWITPFPFVDAILEVANKSVCAGLMAIYAYSPTIATVINLLLFAACLFAFFWIRRRVTYMRTMIFDPLWAMFNNGHRIPKRNELIVFPQSEYKSVPAKAKMLLTQSDAGWKLVSTSWFNPKTIDLSRSNVLEIKRGMLINLLSVNGPDSGKFYFSRRYGDNLDMLAGRLSVNMNGESVADDANKLEMA